VPTDNKPFAQWDKSYFPVRPPGAAEAGTQAAWNSYARLEQGMRGKGQVGQNSGNIEGRFCFIDMESKICHILSKLRFFMKFDMIFSRQGD